MKSRRLSIGLIATITSCSLAQDITFTNCTATFTNLQGNVYAAVTLVRADLDGLIWRDGASGGRVSFTNLDSSLLISLGIPVDRVDQARVRAGQKAVADAKYRATLAAQVAAASTGPATGDDVTPVPDPVIDFWQSYVTNYKVDLSALDSDAFRILPQKAAEAMRNQLKGELQSVDSREKLELAKLEGLQIHELITDLQYEGQKSLIELKYDKQRHLLEEQEMQGEIDAKRAKIREAKRRLPELAAASFDATMKHIQATVALASFEGHADRRALPLPSATTATNQVIGGFGFVLGEELTNGNALAYSNYPVAWTHNKDGGYSCYRASDKPFDQVSALADESGRICIVCGRALSAPLDLFDGTRGVLAARYPERYAGTSEVVFGSDTRCVLLLQGPESVEVFYADEDLWNALQDRITKSKDATIRNALGEKPH